LLWLLLSMPCWGAAGGGGAEAATEVAEVANNQQALDTDRLAQSLIVTLIFHL
jgi:hypothetical protein